MPLFSHLLHSLSQGPNARCDRLLKLGVVRRRPLELLVHMPHKLVHPVRLLLETGACTALYVLHLFLDGLKLPVRLLLVTSIEQGNVLVNLRIEVHVQCSALVL